MIGLENSSHSLNQSDAKRNTDHDLVACVYPRSRNCGWFYFEFSSALKVNFLSFGYCGYFGFGFKTLEKALYHAITDLAASRKLKEDLVIIFHFCLYCQ